VTKTRFICNVCDNDFLSTKKLEGRWYEKAQCKCGSKNLRQEKLIREDVICKYCKSTNMFTNVGVPVSDKKEMPFPCRDCGLVTMITDQLKIHPQEYKFGL